MMQNQGRNSNAIVASTDFGSNVNNFSLNQLTKQLPSAGVIMPGTIPLSTLTDFIIHKTYHDITVMADLLPSKTDVERKIAIAQFATDSHHLFIRFLSLVKWASSVGKVVKCSDISSFLDHQAMLFVDTADKLHLLANQLVVQARLPNFSIPAAVDVLTTGSYPRLPTCIRDQLVHHDPILPKEKKVALKRIDQIILYRLIDEVIPPQIMNLKVENGVVDLLVPCEYRAYLTLMGDGSEIPWRLLKLEFLVEDLEVGSGKSLVHKLQVDYIHELVQSRLFATEKPFYDMFNILHSFCLSLQLEVLQTQANRLLKLSWGKFIQVDEYLPGQKLIISYWRISPYQHQKTPMLITIGQSETDSSKPLQVFHSPKLPLDDLNLSTSSSHIKHLCLEKLIQQSISVRSFHLLNELKTMLLKHIKREVAYFSDEEVGKHTVLFIPLLDPSKKSDCMRIFVDPQTGIFVPCLIGINESIMEKVENDINVSQLLLLKWIKVLRDLLLRQRFINALQELPVTCLDQAQLPSAWSSVLDNDGNYICVKLLQFPLYHLVIQIILDSEWSTRVARKYFLLVTSKESLTNFSLSELNFKFPLDVTNWQSTGMRYHEQCRMDSIREEDELIQIIKVCEAHIPFVSLIQNFAKEDIEYEVIQEEDTDQGLSCKILSLPDVDEVSAEVNLVLQEFFLQCYVTVYDFISKVWSVELTMKNLCISLDSLQQRGPSVNTCFTYKAPSFFNPETNFNPVKSFLEDWLNVARLFGSVYLYLEQLKQTACDLTQLTKVEKYDYTSITIRYGKSFTLFVTITSKKGKKFSLGFGSSGNGPSSNAHWLTKHYLTDMFNSDPDICKLMRTMIDSSEPLQALSRLPSTPVLGVGQKPTTVEQVFTLIAQTATHFRLSFLGVYCLDIYCLGNGKVAIQDASFSQFGFAKLKTAVQSIQGLPSFLMMYKAVVKNVFSLESGNSSSSFRRTQLTHNALSIMCTPTIKSYYAPSPLELFLGTTFAWRHIDQVTASLESVTKISLAQPAADGSDNSLVTAFVARSLQFLCRPNPQLSRLCLKIKPVSTAVQPQDNWDLEDLKILEKFFELRVASSFRFNALKSFFSIITAPTVLLKDFIQVMRLEHLQSRSQGVKWTVCLLLTANHRMPVTTANNSPCVFIKEQKTLIFVQFTQLLPPTQPHAPPTTVVVPLLYDPSKTMVGVFQNSLNNNLITVPHLKHVDALLNHFREMRPTKIVGECTFGAAVAHLMENFNL